MQTPLSHFAWKVDPPKAADGPSQSRTSTHVFSAYALHMHFFEHSSREYISNGRCGLELFWTYLFNEGRASRPGSGGVVAGLVVFELLVFELIVMESLLCNTTFFYIAYAFFEHSSRECISNGLLAKTLKLFWTYLFIREERADAGLVARSWLCLKEIL